MGEAVVAGAVAGAIAGLIAGAAVVFASRSTRPRPGSWQSRTKTFTAAPQPGPTSSRPAAEFANVPASSSFAVGETPFSRFNDRAKRVLALAQDEAIRFNHNYMGTEHILVALVREGEGVAAQVLSASGVELSRVRSALEFIIGRGDGVTAPSEITLSPRTKRVIELAAEEAMRLGHSHVGTEHLLLALVREGQGIACGILESLGLSMESIRERVIARLANGDTTAGPMQPRGGGTVSPARGPFDRFDDRAKRVLALAQDEAIRFNHNYIGPEHVLLGLLRDGEGIAGRVLISVGAELSAVRLEVERLIGRGDSATSPSEITLTPRTKKLIELAIDESRLLGHGAISTEHLLLGIVRDAGSNAGEVLRRLGLNVEAIRQRVIATLGDGGQQPPA